MDDFKNLNDLLKKLKNLDRDILIAIHSEFGDRWKHTGNQIWTIGSIFIPLSLSGIALGLDNFYRTCAVALFSITLIWIWYLISLALRKTVDSNWMSFSLLEFALLDLTPPITKYGIDDLINKIVPSSQKVKISVRKLRIVIALTITLIWLLAVILSLLIRINLIKE